MGLKSRIIRAVATHTKRRIHSEAYRSVKHQKDTFKSLIQQSTSTAFGKEHHFNSIRSHRDFVANVPVRDYEQLRDYIDRIIQGEEDVLWPGKPLYFAKTSGTTSGVKYIPITKESIPNHVGNARNALFNMASRLKLKNLFDGKMIFLSGSPTLDEKGSIPTGRLSGIVNHWVPSWLRTNQLPSYETNCIEEWESKLDQIVKETAQQDLRLISGIPPWVQMYYERLLEFTGKKTVKEVFPNLQLFVYGGVNYEPYRLQLEKLVGDKIAGLETYPASEGFIAYQDTEDNSKGLLLQCHAGIFYEFIPLNEIHNAHPERIMLEHVEKGIDYAIIISTNAGLWAYNIGDTVEFISTEPPRIKVTGRIKHFISAFGEHVISKEVEEALRTTMQKHECLINEFTVAPQVNPGENTKPYHEWWIEFAKPPKNIIQFSRDLDTAMIAQNMYYKDLIEGGILQPLIIRILATGSFRKYMQSIGKLGGQNKVPRLSNDRIIAGVLEEMHRTGDFI